jgi:hypothetical protein
VASLNDLKTLADQYEKNRRIVKSYGDELKKLGLAEKEANSLASKAARLDEANLKKKSDGMKKAKDEINKVADVLGQVRAMGSEAFSGVSNGLSALTKGDVKGTIDGIVDSVAALAKGLDLVYPGLGQAAAALVKFAGGGASLMYELAEKTIDENQKLLELKNTFDALGSNIGNTGDEMVEHFRELSRELPVTRAKLADMARPLLENGVQGDKLDRALKAQTASTAMLGERGGQAYTSLAQRARDAQRQFQPLTLSMNDLLKTGVNSKDMAEQLGMSVEQFNMQLRFGAFNANQFGQALDQALAKKGEKASKGLMSTLGTMIPKLQENIGMLFAFSDKDTTKGLDNFTNMFQKFANIFDDSTASGKMLKETLHDMIDGTLAGAGEILHGARRGFKMLEIVWMTLVTKADPLFVALGDLNKELKKSGGHGITFKEALEGVGKAADVSAKSLAMFVGMATKAIALSNSASESKNPAVRQAGKSIMAVADPFQLMGHASGGVVTGISNGLATVRAADGEGLASIGRGERIVPANDTGNGGKGVSIVVEKGAVTIHGLQGQSALELTEEALALVVERIALKRGIA